MKFRIEQSGSLFYPQRWSWFFGWTYFEDSLAGYDILAYFNSLEAAKGFLREVESGVRNKYGELKEERPVVTTHRYP